jgi:hypothetical protein
MHAKEVNLSGSPTYQRPTFFVGGKTSDLLKGDYGANDDNYRRYEEEKKKETISLPEWKQLLEAGE